MVLLLKYLGHLAARPAVGHGAQVHGAHLIKSGRGLLDGLEANLSLPLNILLAVAELAEHVVESSVAEPSLPGAADAEVGAPGRVIARQAPATAGIQLAHVVWRRQGEHIGCVACATRTCWRLLPVHTWETSDD